MADSWIYLKLADGKTYTLPDSCGFQQPFEGNCQRFTCGKLQMHYLSPMRRWRIFYCGMLNETSCDKKTTEEVFVKFVFLYSFVGRIRLHVGHESQRICKCHSEAKWKKPCVPPVEEFESRKNPSIVESKCISILGTTPSNGFSFHVSEMSTKHLFKELPIGFTVDPEGELDVLKDLNVSVKKGTSEEYPRSFKARFHTGERYEVVGKLMEPIFIQAYQGVDGSMELSFIEFEVGKRKGYGLLILGEVNSAPNISMTKPIAPTTSFPESIPLTVKFTDEASHFGEISGGKGSSLGKLTQLSQKEKSVCLISM
ncbi:prodigiosin synthesizing transferase PigC [Caerostris extrusa]|uniref:Prodigiosin synthesizing transferase PigC n=1 Tax=Caerostris extrusa TaxID=172846 RepID=A0AAV4NG49_CAEEX|nr:prodigiosin synthesizing transferase PigC [Caerostris extrusa]